MFSSDVKIRLWFAVTGKRSCAQLHPSYIFYLLIREALDLAGITIVKVCVKIRRYNHASVKNSSSVLGKSCYAVFW